MVRVSGLDKANLFTDVRKMFRGLQIAERGVLVEAELVDKGLACNSEYVYVKFTKAAAVRLALQRQAEHIH
eukprot:17382-Heterococcus_DN1.PRE.1